MPRGWHFADISLIPKALHLLDPTGYRPITVLPVTLKLALKIWMSATEKNLHLRRLPSQGFRKGVQAAETHLGLRTLVSKHLEWGAEWTYDTLLWTAVQRSFDRRGAPQDLQDMYWRLPKGRRLQFRISDGLVCFSAIASRGLPQGAPESPLI